MLAFWYLLVCEERRLCWVRDLVREMSAIGLVLILV